MKLKSIFTVNAIISFCFGIGLPCGSFRLLFFKLKGIAFSEIPYLPSSDAEEITGPEIRVYADGKQCQIPWIP